MDSLLKYEWPGNVRELMNAVERGVVLAQSEYLDDADLRIFGETSQTAGEPVTLTDETTTKSLEEVEKETVLKTLEASGGNKSETARRLGITRKTLHKKLKTYGVMS
jgi:two-component system response regulator HydG